MNVSEIIDRQSLSRYQLSTIALCGLVLAMDGYNAFTMGFVTTPVSQMTHIPLPAFGPILSASLVGLMLAAMGTGPIADRVGRKWIVIGSTLWFAVFAILTGRATTYHEFLTYRFLTGLGLGGAMPNVVALASEYAPRRLLSVVVTILFVGMPLGSLICGLVSSAVLTTWGWQWVFYVGGIAPLVLVLVLIPGLPESIRFLVVRSKERAKVQRILARIAPGIPMAQIDLAPPGGERPRQGVLVKHLFTEGRALGTILLWIPSFLSLLLIFFIGSWLPSLLKEAGMSVTDGVLATAFVNFGGIFGCLSEGALINAAGAFKVLLSEFLLSAVFFVGVAIFTQPFPLAVVLAFVLGFLVNGVQSGLNALAARFYPTPIRSTGVGWVLGVGRIGSIVGPLAGGVMLSLGWRPRQIIISGAVCALLGWLAIWLSKQLRGVPTAYAIDPEPTRL